MSWGLKLALWLLGLLTLIVVFVGVLLRPPRAVHFCAVALTRFADPVPPNAYALEDLQRFTATLASGNIRCQLQADSPEGTPESQTALVDVRTHLANFLAQVEPGGPDRRWRFSRRGTVIVYISAHGVVDARGEPCLLVHPDARQSGPEWIEVRELLKLVTAEPRLQDATKLVILDAGRLREDWRLGVLQNSFAEALVPVVQQVRETDRNLFVLNSTRLAEQGLWAPEIGGSLFGFAVAAGLSGDADRNPHDNVVSLQELAEYLEGRVDQLARRYRVRTQRPLLIPADASGDLMLAYTDGDQPAAANLPAMDELRKRHAALGQLWQQRDVLAATPAHGDPLPTSDPLSWAELNHVLTRLEQLVAAGQAYDFWSAQQRAGELLSKLGQRTAPIQLPVSSLALSARFDPQLGPEVEQAEAILQQSLAPQDATAAAAAVPPLHMAAASAAVWKSVRDAGAALDRTKTQQGLQFIRASQTAGASPAAVSILPPEIQLLERLEQDLDWQVAGPDVPQWIQAESRGRSGGPGRRPRAPPSRAAVGRGGPATASGTRLPVCRWDGPAEQGTRALYSAVGADGKAGEYGDLATTKSLLTQAWQLRDQVWSMQSDLAEWLMIHQPSPDTLNRLQALIGGTHELGRQLDEFSGEQLAAGSQELGPRLEQLRETLRELEQRIGKLPCNPPTGDSSGPSYEDLLDLTELGPGHLVAVEDLLATVLVTGEARERLRSLYLDELQEQSQRIDPRSDQLGATPVATAGAEPKSDSQRHADYLNAVFSGDSVRHPALELLSRASLPQLPATTRSEELADLANRQEDRAVRLRQLAQFGGLLRRRLNDLVDVKDQWINTSRQQLKQPDLAVAQAREALSGADRLLRGRRTYDVSVARRRSVPAPAAVGSRLPVVVAC